MCRNLYDNNFFYFLTKFKTNNPCFPTFAIIFKYTDFLSSKPNYFYTVIPSIPRQTFGMQEYRRHSLFVVLLFADLTAHRPKTRENRK